MSLMIGRFDASCGECLLTIAKISKVEAEAREMAPGERLAHRTRPG